MCVCVCVCVTAEATSRQTSLEMQYVDAKRKSLIR